MSIRNYLSESTFTAAYWITPQGKVMNCGARKHIDYVCADPRKFGITEREVESMYAKYNEPVGFEGRAREEVLLAVIRKGFIRIRKYKDRWSINVADYNRRAGKILSNWAYEIIQNPKESKYTPVNITSDTGNPPKNITIEELSGIVESHNPVQVITLNEMEYLIETEFQRHLIEAHENDKTSYYRRIDESGIARIVSKLKDDSIEFVMITAFRRSNSLSKNQELNDQLLRDFRTKLGNNKAYGAYRIIGHYDECSVIDSDKECEDMIDPNTGEHGKFVYTIEETWCIINDQKNDKFFDTAVEMAQDYNQDTFIARTATKKFGLYKKSGALSLSFGNISNDTFFSGFVKLIGTRNYSEIKKTRNRGRIFNAVFNVISESLMLATHNPSDSISQKMLFYGMNLLK